MFVATKLFHKAGEGSGGGGGGDQHNLGWYATESALTTAHPTASNGDWAIVGSTDTVWVWDSDTTAWKDTDTKGQVTSVNGQTGAVTVDTLPDQTGQSGKFLTTDGTDASWSDKIQITGSSGTYGILSIGIDTDVSSSTSYGGIGIGYKAKVTGTHGISIGSNAITSTGVSIGKNTSSSGNGISIGGGSAPNGGIHIGMYGKNSTTSTMTVSLGTTGLNYNMYTLLSADGTIPTARLTKVNTTITLAAADWSSNTQTVSVNGVTSTSVVFVAPDPADTTDYVSAGILCTSQGTNSLTFTATTTPSADIDVVVVAM